MITTTVPNNLTTRLPDLAYEKIFGTTPSSQALPSDAFLHKEVLLNPPIHSQYNYLQFLQHLYTFKSIIII